MNIFRNIFKASRMVAVLVISILVLGCTNGKTKVNINQDTGAVESINSDQIIWHVKAIHPEGKLLDVKAIDKEGNIYDVKAIQNSDQTSVLCCAIDKERSIPTAPEPSGSQNRQPPPLLPPARFGQPKPASTEILCTLPPKVCFSCSE